MDEPYAVAQPAMTDLKTAVHLVLKQAPTTGIRNADVGRALGTCAGHVEHNVHIR